MTQFMLIIGDRTENLDILCQSIDKADRFLKNAAHELFTNRQLQFCWYPEGTHGESVHDLFSQAQTEILQGENIKDTVIGQLLIEIFRSSQEVVIWYSSDYNHLPEFTNIEIAMNKIYSDLTESSGEVYVRFRSINVGLTEFQL
jgi:hypothetical protein